MEPKKNPKLDLNRNSGLYFVTGLAIVLFTTWQLLEYKTYDKEKAEYATSLNLADNLEEEVPITQQLHTPPPPPPLSAPAVIEIVEDIEEVEETIIISTEVDQNTFIEDIVHLEDLNMEEVEEDISVPFAVIEKVPVFPGCEQFDSEADKKACFNQKMQEHIKENFQYPKTALDLGITGRVYVRFEINSKGVVSNIMKRGPDKLLEAEAERIITLLPKIKPGIQRGKAVKVGYSIPINFIMQ